MSSRDEYSSDEEEDGEIGKSQVFLGFVDTEIGSDEEDSEYEDPTIEDTFIGGKPVWFKGKARPDAKYTTCDNCGQKLALLLQAFAPLEDKLYDRAIYIFGCKNTAQCSKKKGSIKAIRGVGKDPERVAQIKKENEDAIQKQLDDKLKLENTKKLHMELTKDLFDNSKKAETKDSNPFGGNPFAENNPFAAKESNPFGKETKETNPESSETSKESYASVAGKNAPVVAKAEKDASDADRPSYRGHFIYVEQEKFKKEGVDSELEKYKHLIDMDVNKEDSGRRGSVSSVASGGKQAPLDPGVSKISNMLDDRYFEAFTNTVKHNPGQVLRYDLNGKPLLYSGRDDIATKFGKAGSVPAPGYNPSSKRRFELQLMPKAIMDLEETNVTVKQILDGMSWGTIIVCTDEEDYIPEEKFEDHAGYIEEWCGVQWEESV